MDYSKWTADLLGFVKVHGMRPDLAADDYVTVEVKPPLDDVGLSVVEKELPRPIPGEYRRFLREGASCVKAIWTWEPEAKVAKQLEALGFDARIWGGGTFIPAIELASHLESAHGWATDTWIADEPAQQQLWLNSLPFVAMENADFLALDLSEATDDPAVLYLSHDDESWELSPTFTKFLTKWASIGYLGPEHWVLEPMLDKNRHLNPPAEKVKALASMFPGR